MLPDRECCFRSNTALLMNPQSICCVPSLLLERCSCLSCKGRFMAKKSKKRRAWTATEVRELKSLAKKKTPAGKIAKKLRRTEGATRQKAFSIGLSLDSRS